MLQKTSVFKWTRFSVSLLDFISQKTLQKNECTSQEKEETKQGKNRKYESQKEVESLLLPVPSDVKVVRSRSRIARTWSHFLFNHSNNKHSQNKHIDTTRNKRTRSMRCRV